MKFFTVLATIFAVVVAYTPPWSQRHLSESIINHTTKPVFLPALKQALDIYNKRVSEGNKTPIRIVTQPGVAGNITLEHIAFFMEAQRPSSKEVFETTIKKMMNDLISGQAKENTDILIPAYELTYWSIGDLNVALGSSSTSLALWPYLVKAQDIIMHIHQGQLSTLVVAPADIFASDPKNDPSSIIVVPIAPVKPAPIDPDCHCPPNDANDVCIRD